MNRCTNWEPLQLINVEVTTPTELATITVAYNAVENAEFYTLRYCANLNRVATGSERVQVQVGATGGTPAPVTYPVLLGRDICGVGLAGQDLTVSMLRRRTLLCLRFVAPNNADPTVITPHFAVVNGVFPSVFVAQPPAGA